MWPHLAPPLTPIILALMALVVLGALNDLAKDEIRGWIGRVPYGLLRLAQRRLPAELREAVYDEEWMPELTHILKRSEGVPITRVIRSTWFAFGLLCNARPITDELGPVRARLPNQRSPGPSWLRFLAGFAYGVVTEAGSGISSILWLAVEVAVLIVHGWPASSDGKAAATPKPQTDRPSALSQGPGPGQSPNPQPTPPGAAVKVDTPRARGWIADFLSQRVAEDRVQDPEGSSAPRGRQVPGPGPVR